MGENVKMGKIFV